MKETNTPPQTLNSLVALLTTTTVTKTTDMKERMMHSLARLIIKASLTETEGNRRASMKP
jgi:hypothetical protein